MYVRAHCPHCEKPIYHNINLHAIEQIAFDDITSYSRYAMKHIEVSESVAEDDLADNIRCDLRDWVYDGITIQELYRMIEENYGLAARHCTDLVDRMKIDLGMYSPDGEHLKVIEGYLR